MLEVVQYNRFVSLDGVDWTDREKKKQLYVGTAIHDWTKGRAGKDLDPIKKEPIDRVVGSAALKMADANYLVVPRLIADYGSPIVVNNACASWHRLAKTFSFANARAYLGTLISVSDGEAQEVVSRLLGRHFGKPLAQALWQAQNEVYGNSVRRPYILVGVGTQRLRTTAIDTPVYVIARLRRAFEHWVRRTSELDDSQENKRAVKDYARFLKAEIDRMSERWIRPR
jgi:hypothetical protein